MDQTLSLDQVLNGFCPFCQSMSVEGTKSHSDDDELVHHYTCTRQECTNIAFDYVDPRMMKQGWVEGRIGTMELNGTLEGGETGIMTPEDIGLKSF